MEVERVGLGFFGHEYACAYIGPMCGYIGLRAQPNCMRTHTSSMCAHAYAYTP